MKGLFQRLLHIACWAARYPAIKSARPQVNTPRCLTEVRRHRGVMTFCQFLARGFYEVVPPRHLCWFTKTIDYIYQKPNGYWSDEYQLGQTNWDTTLIYLVGLNPWHYGWNLALLGTRKWRKYLAETSKRGKRSPPRSVSFDGPSNTGLVWRVNGLI